MALRAKENPQAEGALSSRRRQAMPLAISMVCGIALMITFLFQARASLPRLAKPRLYSQISQREKLEEEKQAIPAEEQDGERYLQVSQELRQAKKVEAELRERTNYAVGIEKLNIPISLLNVVLALVAATGGYMFSRASITEEHPRNPKTVSLTAVLDGLIARRNSDLARVRELDAMLQAQIAKVKYLGNSRPLRGWRSKKKRLEGIIPLYRKENAKKRCIDVHSVLAFRQEGELILPEIEEEKAFGLPQDFQIHEVEFKRLRSLILATQRRGPQPEAVERAA